MAKTNVRGSQIADGANGVDLTVDVTGVLPVANGGTGIANPTAGRFLVGNGTSVIDLSKVVPTGTVMGTSDAQVVTNKDLTSGTNTFPSSLSPTLVRVSTLGLITLSGTQTIDGVACAAGDRVLVRHQGVYGGNGFDNGVWVVAAGAWTRATDSDTSAKVAGIKYKVTEGTKFDGFVFQCAFLSTDTLGTTSLSFINTDGMDFGSVFQFPLGNARNGGATYFDGGIRTLRVWDGAAWRFPKGIQDYSSTAPSFPQTGELWYNPTDTGTATLYDSGWIAPALGNSWVNAGGWAAAGYRKINGIVYLKGTMITGTVGQAAFFLPAGYRPAESRMFPDISNSSYGRTQVRASDGAVYIDSGGSNSGWSLDGIVFPAEA